MIIVSAARTLPATVGSSATVLISLLCPYLNFLNLIRGYGPDFLTETVENPYTFDS